MPIVPTVRSIKKKKWVWKLQMLSTTLTHTHRRVADGESLSETYGQITYLHCSRAVLVVIFTAFLLWSSLVRGHPQPPLQTLSRTMYFCRHSLVQITRFKLQWLLFFSSFSASLSLLVHIFGSLGTALGTLAWLWHFRAVFLLGYAWNNVAAFHPALLVCHSPPPPPLPPTTPCDRV